MQKLKRIIKGESSRSLPLSTVQESARGAQQRASSLRDEGSLDEALKELSNALNVSKGMDTEFRIALKEDAAYIHCLKKEIFRAELLYKDILSRRKKQLGNAHQKTLHAARNVATAQVGQGRMEEARKVIQPILQEYENKDGHDCKERFAAMACLGDIHLHQGNPALARDLYERALSGMENSVGLDHDSARDTKYSLAQALASEGQYINAVTYLKDLIMSISQTELMTHPTVLKARSRLGVVYLEMGNTRDAEAELARCLSDFSDTLLRDVGDTMEAETTLLKLYRNSNKSEGVQAIQSWRNDRTVDEILMKAAANSIAGDIGSSNTLLRVGEEAETFNREIKIRKENGTYEIVVALLDTQCQQGNWISHRLVEELRLGSKILGNPLSPILLSGTGQEVQAVGSIELDWKWHPRGTRIYRETFFVSRESSHLDVLFGVEFLVHRKLVNLNTGLMTPLTEHRKFKLSDKAAIAVREEQQRQEKAALEARRSAQGASTQQQSSQSTTQSSQQA